MVFLGLSTPPAQYVLTGHFAQGVNPVPAGQATIADVTYGRKASGALFMAYSQPLAGASYTGFVPIALGSSKSNVIAVQGSGGEPADENALRRIATPQITYSFSLLSRARIWHFAASSWRHRRCIALALPVVRGAVGRVAVQRSTARL